MAILTSGTSSLRIKILGYRDIREEDPEEWLRVHLVANRDGAESDLTDDCLTTLELHGLCAWLRNIAASDYSQPNFWSLEDQPGFSLSDDRMHLSVSVGVWALNLPDRASWVELEFPLDGQALSRFASELAAEAARFPTYGY